MTYEMLREMEANGIRKSETTEEFVKECIAAAIKQRSEETPFGVRYQYAHEQKATVRYFKNEELREMFMKRLRDTGCTMAEYWGTLPSEV